MRCCWACLLAAVAQSWLPDPARTPALSQDTLDATTCAPGWSERTRPPRDFADALKPSSSTR